MGLRVVAVSDPTLPQEITSIPVSGGHTNRVSIVGKKAYVADGYAGMTVLDLTDPTAPQIIGASQASTEAREIKVFGKYAVVADRGELRETPGQYQPSLIVLDISSLPADPVDPTVPPSPVRQPVATRLLELLTTRGAQGQ